MNRNDKITINDKEFELEHLWMFVDSVVYNTKNDIKRFLENHDINLVSFLVDENSLFFASDVINRLDLEQPVEIIHLDKTKHFERQPRHKYIFLSTIDDEAIEADYKCVLFVQNEKNYDEYLNRPMIIDGDGLVVGYGKSYQSKGANLKNLYKECQNTVS